MTASCTGLARKLESASLQLVTGKNKTVDSEDSGTSESDSTSEDSYYDDCNDEDTVMQQYGVNVASPLGEWVEVVEDIRFMRYVRQPACVGSCCLVTLFHEELDVYAPALC
jgi:hypothetical protein